MVELHFSSPDLALLRAALDSHVYWQLSDEHYRRDGHVLEPGSDDGESAEQIAEALQLIRRLDSKPRNVEFQGGEAAPGASADPGDPPVCDRSS